MFILRALDQHINRLGTSIFQLSLGLRDVHRGGHPALVPALREVQRSFKRGHARQQQLLFRIERAHFEVIESEFGVQAQAHRFQVTGAGLRIRTRRLNRMAYSPEHVRFVGHIHRNHQVGPIGLGGRREPAGGLTKDVRARPKRPRSRSDSKPRD